VWAECLAGALEIRTSFWTVDGLVSRAGGLILAADVTAVVVRATASDVAHAVPLVEGLTDSAAKVVVVASEAMSGRAG
jgi:hypothetical protein